MLSLVRREYHGGIVLNSRTFALLVRDADFRRQARRDFATALLAEHQVNHPLAVLRGNWLSAAGGGEETPWSSTEVCLPVLPVRSPIR